MFANVPYRQLIIWSILGGWVLARTIQFFADGWKIPTPSRLRDLEPEFRQRRLREYRIVLVICIALAFLFLFHEIKS